MVPRGLASGPSSLGIPCHLLGRISRAGLGQDGDWTPRVHSWKGPPEGSCSSSYPPERFQWALLPLLSRPRSRGQGRIGGYRGGGEGGERATQSLELGLPVLSGWKGARGWPAGRRPGCCSRRGPPAPWHPLRSGRAPLGPPGHRHLRRLLGGPLQLERQVRSPGRPRSGAVLPLHAPGVQRTR